MVQSWNPRGKNQTFDGSRVRIEKMRNQRTGPSKNTIVTKKC